MFDIGPVDPEILHHNLTHGKATAAGLDGWGDDDLTLVSKAATTWLARMFDTIEAGAPWPEQMLHTKATYLAKDINNMDDALKYRVLLITPILYRRWAATRLQALDEWTAKWALPQMFAGAGNNGAEDAWWCTSVTFEYLRHRGDHITGGVADILKCFDQISRPFLYTMLSLGGFPTGVLKAYTAFQEETLVHNSIAGTLGRPHRRKNGIPQGCPLSMLFVAFLLRAWILLVQDIGGQARVLADDLMAYAAGDDHENLFKKIFDVTHEYLEDMGAKVAHKKSYTFSTSRTTRARLRGHVWEGVKATIKVVNQARDLGSHINFGCRMVGTTITCRMEKALDKIMKIRHTNFPYKVKAMVIRVAILAGALYGAEAAPASDAHLARLTSAIAGTLGPQCRLTSNALVMTTSSYGDDLDPEGEILARRGTMLRRMLVKHPEMDHMVRTICGHYTEEQYKGTWHHNTDIAALTPAPPPGMALRHKWKPTQPPLGPIGLLLGSLHRAAACMDTNLCIHTHNEPTLDLLNVPWQHTRPALKQLAIRARHAHAATKRTQLNGTTEIDTHTLEAALSSLPQEDEAWMRHIVTLGTYTNFKQGEIDEEKDGKCDYCGAEEGTLPHLIWKCPFFHLQRIGAPVAEPVDEQKAIETEADIYGDLENIVDNSSDDEEDVNPLDNPDVHKEPPDGKENNDPKDPDFEDVELKLIPACMQVGIPHAIGASESEWLWDLPGGLHNTTTLPRTLCHKSRLTSSARGLITEVTNKYPGMNARQVVAACRHDTQKLELPDPEFCHLHPPEQPNVHSDGSLKHPRVAHWSLGGFGVWWPERKLQDTPLTDGENQIASKHQVKEGLKMWGCITGQKASSTRAELAAGILTILGPGPIHQGTDSKSYMTRANNILQRNTKRKQKPWSLRADGDLWQLWERAAISKGLHAIKISWFKGHAQQEHIDKGVATEESKKANDIADAVADLGVSTSHQTGLLQLAGYYASKQYKLLQVTKRIQAMILRVLKAENRERSKRKSQAAVEAKEQLGPKHAHITVPEQTGDPPMAEGRSLDLHPPVTQGLSDADLTIQLQLWTFFHHTRWTKVDGQNNGSSWIELLARYQLLGGKLTQGELGDNPLTTPLSFRQALATFKKLALRTINLHAPEHAQWLFKPARAGKPRLEKYGCTSHVPCIMGIMCHDGLSKITLRNALATITAGYNKVHKAITGMTPLTTRPTKISYRGPPPWKNLCLSEHLTQTSQRHLPRDAEPRVRTGKPDDQSQKYLQLSCGSCRATKYQVSRLVNKGTWVPVWCPSCKHTCTAKNWLCGCGALWHKCSEHCTTGFKLKRLPMRSNTAGGRGSSFASQLCRKQVGSLGAPCSKPSDVPRHKSSFFKEISGEPDLSQNSGGQKSRRTFVDARGQQGEDAPPVGNQIVQEPLEPAQSSPGMSTGTKRIAVEGLNRNPKAARIHRENSLPFANRGSKRKATYDHSQSERSVANILASNPRLAARLGKHQTARPPEPK